MSQGKEFTSEQRETILESIKPYLQMGYSVNKACILAMVEPTTVYKWIEKDEALSKKIESWRNMITAVARQNLIKAIQGKRNENYGKPIKDADGKDTKTIDWEEWKIAPSIEEAKWWLERRDKVDFGRNLDITTDGETLQSNTIIFKDFGYEEGIDNEIDNEDDNELETSNATGS